MKILLIVLFVIGSAFAAPWLEVLFGEQPTYNYPISDYYKNQNYRQQRRQGKGGKARWKEICRTINPDQFAFPGQAPYPSGPACPW